MKGQGQNLCRWHPLDEDAKIWKAEYQVPHVISNTLAFQLQSGEWLVWSPGKNCVESFREQVSAHGSPAALLAPNYFHFMGIPQWQAAFPDTPVFAGTEAIPRLEKKGIRGVQPVEAMQQSLGEGIRVLEAPSTRIGEVWLLISTSKGMLWVVCDSFFNYEKLPSGWMGKVMSLMKMGPGLSISRVFGLIAVRQKSAYKRWVHERLEADPPQRMIVAHGSVLEGSDLGERIRGIVEESL